MRKLLLILAILAVPHAALGQSPVPESNSQPPIVETREIPRGLARVLASGDGRTQATAFKVSSVRQEYQILEYLNLRPGRQSLIVAERAYDKIEATDLVTGEQREVWFDISRFFGRAL